MVVASGGFNWNLTPITLIGAIVVDLIQRRRPRLLGVVGCIGELRVPGAGAGRVTRHELFRVCVATPVGNDHLAGFFVDEGDGDLRISRIAHSDAPKAIVVSVPKFSTRISPPSA